MSNKLSMAILPLLLMLSNFSFAVVSGRAVEGNQFTSVVALVNTKHQKSFCSGNLYAKERILTAGHCIFPNNYTWVELNETLKILLKYINEKSSTRVYSVLVVDEDLIKEAFYYYAKMKVKDIGIYTGSGQANGQLLSQKVIADISVPSEVLVRAVQILRRTLLVLNQVPTNFLPTIPDITETDHVVLKLKSGALSDIKPTPVAASSLFAEYVHPGHTNMEAVGFGVQDSPRLAEESLKLYMELQRMFQRQNYDLELLQLIYNYFTIKLENTRNQLRTYSVFESSRSIYYEEVIANLDYLLSDLQNPVKQAEVLESIQAIATTLASHASLSQNKKAIELRVHNIAENSITMMPVNLEMTQAQGMCNGDSGGPLFTKINDKYFQVGVTSVVTECGEFSVHTTVSTQKVEQLETL